MSKLSRNKGAAFERWLCDALHTQLGLDEKPKRNLNQYQSAGQCDIIIGSMSIEAKHYAKGNWFKEVWWEQAVHAAGADKYPVLIYKFDRIPPRIVLPACMVSEQIEDKLRTLRCVFSWEEGIEIMRIHVNDR